MVNYSFFVKSASLELFDYGDVVLVWTYENFHAMACNFYVLILLAEGNNFHT